MVKGDKRLQIGSFVSANPIFTAPMAGITDRPFRDILHRMGAGLVFTEMVSDMALVYKNKETHAMLNLLGETRPIAVQLCGSQPEIMAEAAQIIVEKGASLLDINMGCPAPKIVKNGEGCALMRQPERAVAIVKAVRRAVSLPLTVKMRKGWDDNHTNVVSFAQAIADAGADAIIVHGRTREEFYSGQADWQTIQKVATAVTVPVIGNGDIQQPEQTVAHLAASGCAGVMIGRGMLGNPWLIRDAVRLSQGLPASGKPVITEVFSLARQHLAAQIELCGEKSGIQQMRKHFAWYIKGQRGAAAMRNAINRQETLADLLALLAAYEKELLEYEEERYVAANPRL